jgi:DNA (cytosine-5)-methyltransferase 1
VSEPDFKVVSTFSGCGGSSLGYQLADGKVLLACEWDQNAVDTYRANFPSTDVFHGDIAKLSVDEVLRRTGLKPGELDIFDGSPPCQGFSTSGRRDFADPRNQLFREYCRLLRGLRPKVFIMENVKGMILGKMKLTFAVILRELKSCGYQVKARVLNAAFFGVPQARQRIIFVGVRDDLGIEPSFPAPSTSPISARAALIGVQNDPAEVAMLLAAGRKYSAYKDWSKIPVGSNRHKAGLGSGFNACKFHPDKPAQTIRKMDGNLGMHGCLHWAEQRRFTLAELKRFGSFPDDFKFVGTWSDAVERMGNCVPPLFMKAIAAHIRDAILSQIPKGE